jgi:hypothetical protein
MWQVLLNVLLILNKRQPDGRYSISCHVSFQDGEPVARGELYQAGNDRTMQASHIESIKSCHEEEIESNNSTPNVFNVGRSSCPNEVISAQFESLGDRASAWLEATKDHGIDRITTSALFSEIVITFQGSIQTSLVEQPLFLASRLVCRAQRRTKSADLS